MGMPKASLSATGVSESRLRKIWQGQLAIRRDFVSNEGTPFRIVYPGRTNHGQGPDVLDAVISRGNCLVRGDIEFHVKSSSWWEHRHHMNPV